ncbi:MAG: hypothetical protein ABW185_05270 [Sedimenticola sp.]
MVRFNVLDEFTTAYKNVYNHIFAAKKWRLFLAAVVQFINCHWCYVGGAVLVIGLPARVFGGEVADSHNLDFFVTGSVSWLPPEMVSSPAIAVDAEGCSVEGLGLIERKHEHFRSMSMHV